MTESSPQAAQQAEAKALKKRQAEQNKAIKDAQIATIEAFHNEAAALDAGDIVVKEGDVLLVNRDGVDYKVSFDEVVDSLPICGPHVTKDDLTGDFEYLGKVNPNDLNTYVENWPEASTGNKLEGSSTELEYINHEGPLYKLSGEGNPNRHHETYAKFKAQNQYVTYIDAAGDEQRAKIREWYEFVDWETRIGFVAIEVQGIPEEDITLTNETKLENACVPGLEQVVMSGDTSGFGIHCDGNQSTFMGAGIKANIVRCESVSYFDGRMTANGGINVGNHIYFADEWDEWKSDNQGQISNVYRLDFGDYKDEGKATQISKVENIYFKSGDEYATDYGGMIAGCNTIHLNRNEETDNPTMITGVTKLYFEENDADGIHDHVAKSQVTGLAVLGMEAGLVTGVNKLRFSEDDEAEPAAITGLTNLRFSADSEAALTGLTKIRVSENFDSNIVSQLPELPD